MLKIILPNKKKHSFTYNLGSPLKEILNNFCAKKGLLLEIYECYDPDTKKTLDDNKSARDYNLSKLYLRRVKPSKGSVNDGLETVTSKEQLSPSIPTNDMLSFSLSIESPNVTTEKKQRSSPFRKNKNKDTNQNESTKIPTKPKYTDGLTLAVPNGNMKTNSKSKDDVKRKRQAPLAPNTIDIFDITIPSPPHSPPPPYEFCDYESQTFPWQRDQSSGVDEYSEIGELLPTFESYATIQSLQTDNLETPLCTSLDCSKKTPNSIPEKMYSPSSVVQSSVSVQFFQNGNNSDPEDHVYSVIKKSPSNSDDSLLNTDKQLNNQNLSSLPVGNRQTDSAPSDSIPGHAVDAKVDAEEESLESDNSSIDTPMVPRSSKKSYKDVLEKKNETIQFILNPAVPKSKQKIINFQVPLQEATKPLVTSRTEDAVLKKNENSVDSVDSSKDMKPAIGIKSQTGNAALPPKGMVRTTKPQIQTKPKPQDVGNRGLIPDTSISTTNQSDENKNNESQNTEVLTRVHHDNKHISNIQNNATSAVAQYKYRLKSYQLTEN